MRLMLLDRRGAIAWQSRWGLFPLLFAPLLIGWVSRGLISEDGLSDAIEERALHQFELALSEQQQAVRSIEAGRASEVEALTVQLAQMQAQLTRMEAFGQYIVKAAKLPREEFDFRAPPAVGGIAEAPTNAVKGEFNLGRAIAELKASLQQREDQLEILSSFLVWKGTDPAPDPTLPLLPADGLLVSPLLRGWVSSPFGQRIDPFHGALASHMGLDLAGPFNSEVRSVAAGVVVFAGTQSGYGQMVEVKHADGLTSRYAHLNALIGEVGQVVDAGDVIGRLGATGRATGPHLHLEILKDSVQVDPAPLLRIDG